MPSLRGDDLSIAVTNFYFKKLMLTGKVDYPTAIKLLNHKIIDNFIEKNPDNGTETIYKEICELQKNYFCDLIKPIVDHVLNADIVYSEEYIKIIQKILNEYPIHEYYLLSQNGSQLFLEKNGKQHWLIISTPNEFQGWYTTADLADAPKAILNVLAEKTKLLFLFEDKELKMGPNNWSNYLYSTTQVILKNTIFYYAIISEQKNLNSMITS